MAERRFSQEQYDMLKRCSEKKDVAEWNEWRENNPDVKILLERADFQGAHLENANLEGVHLENANLEGAHLRNAHLIGAHLENTSLWIAHLENARLSRSHLANANLWRAHLENAQIMTAHLANANLEGAHLENSNFQYAIVDGSTLITNVTIDKNTDFTGVGLDNIRIDPEIKILLKYNIRCKNWEEWYKKHLILKYPARAFWWMTNYGMSTSRIFYTFFISAVLFSSIYFLWGLFNPPGIIDNLFPEGNIGYNYFHIIWRSLYFSIVTMTTLGLGDMYAYKQGWFGHGILMLQVLWGYIILGAIITRLSILFTAGGPARSFTKHKKKKEKEQ